MAQEKQSPPLAKTARKAGNGKPINSAGNNAVEVSNRPNSSKTPASKKQAGPLGERPKDRSTPSVGQPGGPNVEAAPQIPRSDKKISDRHVSERPQDGGRATARSVSSTNIADRRTDHRNVERLSAGRSSAERHAEERGQTSEAYIQKEAAREQAGSGQERRRAAPARRRFAANDDVPSIGGLIFALQQRPSNRPFVIAGIASFVWAALSAAMVWSVFRTAFTEISTLAELFQSPTAVATVAVVVIPIALFWFLALLIWRAQELRLMSSAMTEVAVRLAEPDKAAEQSVASLGQSVRRQVTAMNDAISRALGRAGELEAMVHNEVAALERSYSENEIRIRSLIGELAHERAALTSDSERISSALTGVGQRVTKQIEQQGMHTTQLLEQTSGAVTSKLLESSDKVAQSMSEQSNAVVSNMTTMNDRVSREMPALLERMGAEQVKLNQVVEHAGKNLSALDSSIGHHAGALNNALTDRTQQLEGIFRKHVQTMSIAMEERSQTLDNTLGNKIQTFDNTLLQRLDDFEETLSDTTDKIDQTLMGKAQYLDMAISSRVAELDSALIERTKVIDTAFTERLHALDNALHTTSKTLDQAFAHKAEELGRSIDSRSQYIVQTISMKTKELDNALMSGAKTLQLTTDDVGKQVMTTIQGLAGQAQVLKEVSNGMQTHVHQITNSLREQSQLVLHAASTLEDSHDRIGDKLGSSQVNLQHLVESISTRTADLDHVMASYSQQLDRTLSQAELKAREITNSLHTQSHSQSMEALSELTKLRDAATSQTERAILDMKDRIASVSDEMSSQITNLSSEISDTQNNLKQQLQQIPDTTIKSATLMRRTLQDQLKALESLSSISNGSNHVDISSPGGGSLKSGADPYASQADLSNSSYNPSDFRRGEAPLAASGSPLNPGGGIAPNNPGHSPMTGQNNLGQHSPSHNPAGPVHHGASNGQGFGGHDIAEQKYTQQQGGLGKNYTAGLRRDTNERDHELEAITENLAKRVSAQLDSTNSAITAPQNEPLKPSGFMGQNGGSPRGGSSHWSMGDLLARASEDDDDHEPTPASSMSPMSRAGAPEGGAGGQDAMPPINISAIAQLVDQSTAVELWRTYRSGLRTPINETVYNDNGEAFRRINGLYGSDGAFRSNVDRYIGDFERLLSDAERKDPAGNLSTKHLTSESGRVYLLLMHAAGRIGQ
ncbi:MAG: hypothetical protein DHS20C08_02130 [Rhodomicrobium sp.]|nr:MAG: hypothetical protein DHS20C08_02130 [Rhodomicrobium sp.]